MSGLPLFDAAWSERAKQEGISRATMSNETFVSVMRLAARRIAMEQGSVHVDDVRRVAERMGVAPKSSAAWGCVFSERGVWEIVGYRASAVVSNHRHRSPVRRLVAA